MNPEEIEITDWLRIVLGDVPWSFLIEVIIRITFIFLILMLSMRLMGKRMATQLTRNEMAGLVTLAAAIGVPMADPTRGLLQILIIAGVVVGVQRVVTWRALKSPEFESAVLGKIDIVVKDGVMCLDQMKETNLTRERLFAELRSNQVVSLGNVERVYMEANGSFTIYEFEESKPGLSIIPRWDDFFDEQSFEKDAYACCSCGNVLREQEDKPDSPCKCCGAEDWDRAICA